MLAVIEIGGKQYKVEKDSVIKTEKVDVEEGKEVTFDKVLLLKDKTTSIGTPYVEKAQVKCKVLEQGKADKIKVFKMKPKKRYQKTQGHRQRYSKLKVVSIK